VHSVHFVDGPEVLNCGVEKARVPVFRNPRQDFVEEGLQLTLLSDSRGRLILLSPLEAESYLLRPRGSGLEREW